ncbi:MAG: methyltransferase [Dehalococcoidales bacterium]|nr:methyltransferase [Dehalococcoidales bacterium]
MDIPRTSPARIVALRDSAFACDLFVTAVSQFDFFNFLDKSPSDIASICNSLGIKSRPADVMLTLFKAYGFVKEKDKKYLLTDTSRDYLTDNSGFDLSSYVGSLKNRPICEDMAKVLRTGRPANWAASKTGSDWATSMADDGFAESFTAGMNSRGAYLANGLIKAVDLIKYLRVLDIGGASGIYTIALLESNPNLSATVFEKPPVDNLARYSINKSGLNDRIDVVAGDMFQDALPGGHDVHLLSHVLHDWDIEEVETVLKNSYNHLAPGGKIIIHDAHINRRKTGPVSVAEYSVLLMFLAEGKCYSVAEMQDVLEKTGFRNIEYRPTVLNRSIVTGTKE